MKKNRVNKNVLNMSEQVENMLMYLNQLELLYFYIKPKIYEKNGNHIITWNNHESGRANAGDSFTKIEQYGHLLKANAFLCILFDGSVIRSSFEYQEDFLINHSHLWWPAPYSDYNMLDSELTPELKLEEFLTDCNWNELLRMRSPVRVDFDPDNESYNHPQVHMHTQHHETRIHVSKPMCFVQFIDFIFKNYYPHIHLDLSKWQKMNFKYSKPKLSNHEFSSFIL